MRYSTLAATMCWLLFAPTVLRAQPPPEQTFPTSLHATRAGKQYFYSSANGGFEKLTGIPMAELPCRNCHAPTRADGTPINDATYQPDCTDCHKQPGDTVADSTCLGCHSRQALERKLYPNDVHLAAGFTCIDCHSEREMYGDGTSYVSQLDHGAMDTNCQNCHLSVQDYNEAHFQHIDTVDCSACHAESVVTCNDCHFDSQIAGGGRRYYTPAVSGFTFLVRSKYSGKIVTATMQTLVYQDKSFVVIAPYTAHTVTGKARPCADCHDSANMKAYFANGKLAITQWNASANELNTISGVIPVPPDWQTAFTFDYVTYTGNAADPVTDPNAWVFAKSSTDLRQMLFAEPLTTAQIEAMRTAETESTEPWVPPADSSVPTTPAEPSQPPTPPATSPSTGNGGAIDPLLTALLIFALARRRGRLG